MPTICRTDAAPPRTSRPATIVEQLNRDESEGGRVEEVPKMFDCGVVGGGGIAMNSARVPSQIPKYLNNLVYFVTCTFDH